MLLDWPERSCDTRRPPRSNCWDRRVLDCHAPPPPLQAQVEMLRGRKCDGSGIFDTSWGHITHVVDVKVRNQLSPCRRSDPPMPGRWGGRFACPDSAGESPA